jgi:hypothetical protein
MVKIPGDPVQMLFSGTHGRSPAGFGNEASPAGLEYAIPGETGKDFLKITCGKRGITITKREMETACFPLTTLMRPSLQ